MKFLFFFFSLSQKKSHIIQSEERKRESLSKGLRQSTIRKIVRFLEWRESGWWLLSLIIIIGGRFLLFVFLFCGLFLLANQQLVWDARQCAHSMTPTQSCRAVSHWLLPSGLANGLSIVLGFFDFLSKDSRESNKISPREFIKRARLLILELKISDKSIAFWFYSFIMILVVWHCYWRAFMKHDREERWQKDKHTQTHIHS